MPMFEPEAELHENPDGSYRLLTRTRVPNACFRGDKAAVGTPPGVSVGRSVLPVVLLFRYDKNLACSQDVSHVWHHMDGLGLGPRHGRSQVNVYALLDYRLAGQSSVRVPESKAEEPPPAAEQAKAEPSQEASDRAPEDQAAKPSEPAEAEPEPRAEEPAKRPEPTEAEPPPPDEAPEKSARAAPGSVAAVASGFAAQGFKAWTRGPAGAPARLIVAGVLLAPSPGYTAALAPAAGGPSEPGVLVLDMAIVAKQGDFAAAPTEIPVRFETPLPGAAAPAKVKLRIPVAADLELPVGAGN
jgi:hypothetical protein